MKGSLTIIAFFVFGVLVARLGWWPEGISEDALSRWVLYALMFLVGISVGSDVKALRALRSQHVTALLVPLATVVGTWIGCLVVWPLLPGRTLADCLAVGSGFGYYSLSSIFITEYRGAELGTIALAANVLREIITLLGAEWMVKHFGRLAPICAGGATTMDTTMPVIVRFSGKEYVAVAILHGFLVDFSVPFLVTLFAG